jgi:hypothetical protein
MSVQDTAQKLIAILGDTALPYDTAEKIIAEVKRGQPDVREKVMVMLLEFQTTVLQKKIEVDKTLKEELQRLNSKTNFK